MITFKTPLLVGEIKEFLRDYASNCQTEILEEESKKNELIEIAKKRGINLAGSMDLAGFKNVYAMIDLANKNGCRLPRKAVEESLHTLIGKPVDIDHIRRFVVGHYIDAKIEGDKIVTYGVFYKSNFAEEWDEAKELFKEGKLTTSFEILCPKNKRTYHDDGTYSLNEMEFSGGGILFKTSPAFPQAKVLELAKTNSGLHPDLVVASEYSCEDMIIAEEKICMNCVKCAHSKIETAGDSVAEAPAQMSQPAELKITCEHCQEVFDYNKAPGHRGIGVKCPKCFSVVDNTGKVVLPPQVVDFNLACLDCQAVNWEILNSSEEKEDIKCLSCSKEFTVNFEKPGAKTVLSDLVFTACEVNYPCPQCHKSVKFFVLSYEQEKELKCSNCGVKFPFTIKMSKGKKKICNILPKKENAEKIENSMEGGKTMLLKDLLDFLLAEVKEGDNCPVLDMSALEIEAEDQALEEAMAELAEGSEEAKKLTYEQRKEITDDKFAVVVTVKNKVTGEPRKIRMFPIADENHVRNALARLPQAVNTLKKLGVSVDEVKNKILKRAEELNMKDLLERHDQADAPAPAKEEKPEDKPAQATQEQTVSAEEQLKQEIETLKATISKKDEEIVGLKKSLEEAVASKDSDVKAKDEQLKTKDAELASLKDSLEREKASINAEADKKVEFYKVNAVKIQERRMELGEFAKDLSNEDIVDDKNYEIAKLRKENIKKNTSSEKKDVPLSGEGKDTNSTVKGLIDRTVAQKKGRDSK